MPRDRRQRRTARRYVKEIQRARLAIVVVAALMLAVNGFLLFAVQTAEVLGDGDPTVAPEMDEAVAAQVRLAALLGLLLGAGFMGLFFWAKTDPFRATLTALVLYLALLGFRVATNPESLMNACGIIVPLVVVVALANGMFAGLTYQRMIERERRARRAQRD